MSNATLADQGAASHKSVDPSMSVNRNEMLFAESVSLHVEIRFGPAL